MLRLLFALIVVGALGHFVRWVFAHRLPGLARKAAPPGRDGAVAAPASTVRRLLVSAGRSVLVGGAVVLALFVGKLIYFEFVRPHPAGGRTGELPAMLARA